MAGHEVDDLRRNLLGRAHEIAFVFPIFVVDDDNHAPVADVANGVVDGRYGHTKVMLTESPKLINRSVVSSPWSLVIARDFKDRKSTRLNSSHSQTSYAVFCLKKKR